MEFDRRTFVKGAAATAAFLPSFSILRAEDKDITIGPKDDDINVAMIGFGAEGKVLAASLVRIPGVRVRAVCDIWRFEQQRAKAFFKGYGHTVNTYEDYREMLEKEDKNIDAVIVATPDWMHCEHTCACLRAGKHVYCEKEMSNRLELAAEMCRVQKETGKLLQIGHQRRSNPRYRHCFEHIVPNMLGRVTTAYAQWQIDLFIWAWGVPPSSVTAIGGKDAFDPPREAYDRMYCIYEFKMPDGTKNEAIYQVISSNARGGFYEQFMGVNASLTIAEISARGNTVQRELRQGGLSDAEWQKFIDKGWILPNEGDKVKKEVTKDIAVDTRISAQANGNQLAIEMNKPAHMPHLENFFAACRHGAALNCPAELAYESAVAVLAANKSADSHAKYVFKPEEFKVPPRAS